MAYVVATGVAMRRGPAALESLRRVKYNLGRIATLDEPPDHPAPRRLTRRNRHA